MGRVVAWTATDQHPVTRRNRTAQSSSCPHGALPVAVLAAASTKRALVCAYSMASAHTTAVAHAAGRQYGEKSRTAGAAASSTRTLPSQVTVDKLIRKVYGTSGVECCPQLRMGRGGCEVPHRAVGAGPDVVAVVEEGRAVLVAHGQVQSVARGHNRAPVLPGRSPREEAPRGPFLRHPRPGQAREGRGDSHAAAGPTRPRTPACQATICGEPSSRLRTKSRPATPCVARLPAVADDPSRRTPPARQRTGVMSWPDPATSSQPRLADVSVVDRSARPAQGSACDTG